MALKFEVFQDHAGEWRFRIKADNHEIVSQSEGYQNRSDAYETVGLIQAEAADAEIEEIVNHDERGAQ